MSEKIKKLEEKIIVAMKNKDFQTAFQLDKEVQQLENKNKLSK